MCALVPQLRNPRFFFSFLPQEGLLRKVSAAATFGRELCGKNKFRTVEFEGIHNAILPQTDLNGNRHIEYLEKIRPAGRSSSRMDCQGNFKDLGSEKKGMDE